MEYNEVLERELHYHEYLYSGFAQNHFARPAVRALRRHMVQRILSLSGLNSKSNILSLGCGIGDTELLLAPHVGQILGVDLSPKAVCQAESDARRLDVKNARFLACDADSVNGEFDTVIAIFFLHHLPNAALAELPRRILRMLRGGGVFYSLDPSKQRLSGAVGRLLIPKLMKKYQTADERELEKAAVANLFANAGFTVEPGIYDFGSSPLAGLFPGWKAGYQAARKLDDWLLRFPFLRNRGSNFEIIARKPATSSAARDCSPAGADSSDARPASGQPR